MYSSQASTSERTETKIDKREKERKVPNLKASIPQTTYSSQTSTSERTESKMDKREKERKELNPKASKPQTMYSSQTSTSERTESKIDKREKEKKELLEQNPKSSNVRHSNEGSPAPKHIMISYHRESQALVMQIKERLTELNYQVWLNVGNMEGPMLVTMAKAVENSVIVLICASQKYKESPNCRTEAEYACRLKKEIIPLVVEPRYQPDGWLGAVQGTKLYYDFSNLKNFDEVFSNLVKKLGNKGKLSIDAIDEPSILTNSVMHWSRDRVEEWALSCKIDSQNIKSLDGKQLNFANFLRETSLQSFYNHVSEDLGISDASEMAKLCKGLEELTRESKENTTEALPVLGDDNKTDDFKQSESKHDRKSLTERLPKLDFDQTKFDNDLKQEQQLKEDTKNDRPLKEHPSSTQKHIMISYQWEYQKIVMQIKRELEKQNYRVWVDLEKMKGFMLQAASKAIENSDAVLLCLSRAYRDSLNCREEAAYARKLGKALIPVLVEPKYDPDEWLGLIVASRLFFDFSNPEKFDSTFSKLIKELGNKGKASTR